MPRLRSRRLRAARLESLESRQLLSANDLSGNVTAKPVGTVAAQEAQEVARFSLLDIGMIERGDRTVALAAPSGDFQALSFQASSFVVADSWQFLDAQDYTGDGIVDLLGQTPDGSFWLRMNDGEQLVEMRWGDDILGETELISIADFTGDDLPDLLSYDRSNGKMWVSANSPEMGFRHELWTYFTPKAEWTNFFVGEFSGDGLNDVLATETGGGVWLAENKGNPGFKNSYWGRFPNFDWQDVVTGDFDGDGIQDLSARGPDDTWWNWKGSADGFELAEYWGHWKMASGWTDLQVADFNNDGRDDILGRTEDGTLRVGQSSMHGLSTKTWGDGWLSAGEWSNVTIVDINGDGLPDQLGRAKDDTWWYAKNNGDSFQNHFWQRQKGSEHFVVVKDFHQSTKPAVDSGVFTASAIVELEPDENGVSESGSVSESVSVSESGSVSAAPVIATAETMEDTDGAVASVIADPPIVSANAGVRVSLGDDNRIVLTGSGQKMFRIELTSPSGSLIPIANSGSPKPLQFAIQNTQYQITLASLGMPVPLKGSVALDIRWNPTTTANDLRVQYSDGELLDAAIDFLD